MSRKDYELIANTIRCSQQVDSIGRELLAAEFADVLQQGNARFDRARFIRACVA